MSDPWAIIQSLGVKHFVLDSGFFKAGNQKCQEVFSKVPFFFEEDSTEVEEDGELFACHHFGCGEKFRSIAEESNHQRAKHMNTCQTCNATFPSYHLLDCHLLEIHDSLFSLMAKKKPMYQCLVETCREFFQSPKERKEHCIKAHKFPSDFRFNLNWRKGKNKTAKTKGFALDSFEMDVTVDASTQQDGRTKNPTCKPKIPVTVAFGSGIPKSFRTKKEKRKQPGTLEKMDTAPLEENSCDSSKILSLQVLDNALSNLT